MVHYNLMGPTRIDYIHLLDKKGLFTICHLGFFLNVLGQVMGYRDKHKVGGIESYVILMDVTSQQWNVLCYNTYTKCKQRLPERPFQCNVYGFNKYHQITNTY